MEINEDHLNKNKKKLFIQSLLWQLPLPEFWQRLRDRQGVGSFIVERGGVRGCPDWRLLAWGCWR